MAPQWFCSPTDPSACAAQPRTDQCEMQLEREQARDALKRTKLEREHEKQVTSKQRDTEADVITFTPSRKAEERVVMSLKARNLQREQMQLQHETAWTQPTTQDMPLSSVKADVGAKSEFQEVRDSYRSFKSSASSQSERRFTATSTSSSFLATRGRRMSMIRPLSKPYHVFLSYRVSSDRELAEKLYDKLSLQGLNVWWDKVSLEHGAQWEEAFVMGICDSACFVPILSRGALAPYSTLAEESPVDNMLLEQQVALELHSRGMIAAICPVLVGELFHAAEISTERLYTDFFESESKPSCDKVIVRSIDKALADNMTKVGVQGELVRTAPQRTVKSTLNALLTFQALMLKGLETMAVQNVVQNLTETASLATADITPSDSITDSSLSTELGTMEA